MQTMMKSKISTLKTKQAPKTPPPPSISTNVEAAVFNHTELRNKLLEEVLNLTKEKLSKEKKEAITSTFVSFRDYLSTVAKKNTSDSRNYSDDRGNYVYESSCCGVTELTGIGSGNKEALVKKLIKVFGSTGYDELHAAYFKYFCNTSDPSAKRLIEWLQSLGWKTTGHFWNWNMGHHNIELTADYGGVDYSDHDDEDDDEF